MICWRTYPAIAVLAFATGAVPRREYHTDDGANVTLPLGLVLGSVGFVAGGNDCIVRSARAVKPPSLRRTVTSASRHVSTGRDSWSAAVHVNARFAGEVPTVRVFADTYCVEPRPTDTITSPGCADVAPHRVTVRSFPTVWAKFDMSRMRDTPPVAGSGSAAADDTAWSERA